MTVNLHAGAGGERRRVWDAPVRVVHLLLITCVAGAWLTREAQMIDLHAAFGYCGLALVCFRIAWGFLGSTHARFRSFAYSPRETVEYLQGALRSAPRHYTGHNPAGSWAVFGLLLLIGAAAVSGVIAIGALYGEGPIAPLAFATADEILRWHDIFAWAVLGLALLHVLGAAWGSVIHRENLPVAMLTGRKNVHDPATADAPASAALATLVLVGTAAIAVAYIGLWSPRDVEHRLREEGAVKAATKSQPWTKECGSCHLAYSPALLPMASWLRTLEEQDKHFGEDLGIGEKAGQALLEHARTAASPSWGAWKVSSSVPAGQAPLEISATPFWRDAHASLAETEFKPPGAAGRHDCEACHRDAASGIFHPRMIQKAKGRVSK